MSAGPDTSADSRARLLLVHGWAHDAQTFAPLIAELAPHLACLALDLPGHGQRVEERKCPGLARLADDLAAAIAPGDFVLGWSLGALVVLEALARADVRRRVRGAILLAGTASFLARADYSAGPDGQVLFRLRQWLARDPAVAVTRFRSWLDAPADAAVPARPDRVVLDATLGILARSDLRRHLAAIDVPVLLIHGRDDRVVPLAASHFLAAHLPRAVLLERAGGHALFLADPRGTAEAILDFASRHRAG